MSKRKIKPEMRASARIYIPKYLLDYFRSQDKPIVDQVVERFPEVKPKTTHQTDNNQLEIFTT